MNVDWDEIENRYKEVPAAKSNPPQLTESTEITENTGGRHYSPNLVATIENSNSFSLPKNKIPDTIVNIVKPSVSSVDDYITVKPDRK